jgi:hypothetical protein
MVHAALVTWPASWSAAFAQTSPVSLEEGLTTQYKQGTVLVLQTNGVVGVNAACGVRPGSIFKDGQLHAPGIVQKSIVGAAKCDTRAFPVGSQVYLAVAPGFSLKNNRIDFIFLQCDVANCSSGVETSYKAQVAFEFPKGYLATAGLGAVQDTIKHVFSVDTSANFTGSGQTTDAGNQPALSGSPSPATLGSAYVSAQNAADRLQLNADGSFSLQEGGQSFSGTYSVAGTTLTLRVVQLQKDVDIVIRANQLIVNGDEAWVPLAAGTGAGTPTAIVPASVAQPVPQPTDPDAMAARMLSELPSPERIGQAVRVFLAEMKQKGALPQEAFAVATPTVMPSGFDMGGSQPSVTAATGIFELRNATYECGSADSGPKSKSKKGSVLYTLSAKIQKQTQQQWTLQEIAVSGRNCSPTWQVHIPVP